MEGQGWQEVEVRTKAVQTLFRVPAHLEFIKALGAGAYGCVAAFRDTATGDRIAVKKVTNAFHDLVDGKRVLREVKLLQQVGHANIIRILDLYPPASPSFDDIYIVTDLMDTDLHKVIYSNAVLTEEHQQYFSYHILLGLAYLHSIGVVHRDLKPGNILVNKDCGIKICDFGLARVQLWEEESALDGQPTDYVVTRWYRPPEVVLLPSRYTHAIDVWAVGCILGETIRRKPLFPGKDYRDQVEKIVEVLGTPAEEQLRWLPAAGPARNFLGACRAAPGACWGELFPHSSPAAHAALRELLNFDPTARIPAREALSLEFFGAFFDRGDLDHPARPDHLDWSFDNFEPTKPLLQSYLYRECAGFHPEIVERDRQLLGACGLEELLEKGGC